MLMTANVSWSAKREKYYVEDSGRWREATHKDLHDIYPALPRDVWYGRNAEGQVVSLDDPSMPHIPQPAPERKAWSTPEPMRARLDINGLTVYRLAVIGMLVAICLKEWI